VVIEPDFNTGGSLKTTPTVVQRNDYYPFGMLQGGLTAQEQEITDNHYLYNGKEAQARKFTNNGVEAYTNLNWVDYGWRMYDITGRFTTIDPLAEKYYSISPYAYVANNPLRFIDPDGRYIGDYYAMNGEYLGSDGKVDKQVYIVNTSTSMGLEYSQDELIKLGESAGTDGFVTNLTETTGLTHDQFLKFAALAANENNNSEAKFAQANTMFNRYSSERFNENFQKAFNSFSGSETKDLHKKLMKKEDGNYAQFYNAILQH